MAVDLLLVFSFRSRAACVAVEMGLFRSLVLSTLPSPRLVLAPAAGVAPVPPFAMATVPVTFAALPLMLPVTFEPATVTILASVTLASASLVVVTDWSDSLMFVTAASASLIVLTALLATVGLGYVPVRSPPALPTGVATPALIA